MVLARYLCRTAHPQNRFRRWISPMQKNHDHIAAIAREFGLAERQVEATIKLLEEGGTVPFIARYRKEATGMLDEVAIAAVRDRLEELIELDKRRDAVLKSLKERGLLTDKLEQDLEAAATLAEVEDIYLPYKPKRRTRATIAREKGLECLASMLLAQHADKPIDPVIEAAAFVNEEKGVATVEEALAGARDILAEAASEQATVRAAMRELYTRQADMTSRLRKGKEQEGATYRDYFERTERIARAPSHRVLAMLRGEKEGVLAVRIAPKEDAAVRVFLRTFVKNDTPAARQVTAALHDGYKRLLGPSIENEIRAEMKRRADEYAICVFVENLRELLLAPPLGQKNVLALDPGFRTGCKLVCLDAQGQLLHDDTIYPHSGKDGYARARQTMADLFAQFAIEAIAIGNGTAGRETEAFVRELGLDKTILTVMVNESGASVYSASEVARDEFPKHDVTVRGAVSIGRRLMDPLAELVKIDPKSIGVGQYQHDVDQAALRRSLDDTVMSCVNNVGVDLNTASKQLLTYVSGLGPQLAANIVAYRDEYGPFAARSQLKKVPRLGDKAFLQAAGFLRIRGGRNPLDSSAVHPESYHVVDAMAADLDCTVGDLLSDETRRAAIKLDDYVSETVGLPTLRDIVAELARPGRDPRQEFEAFSFAEGINALGDVEVGMVLPGIVTNVTAFGAFVDIGVHQDGLVHISQMADTFVKDPADVVKVQQWVTVMVLEVDHERKRIGLSMKN